MGAVVAMSVGMGVVDGLVGGGGKDPCALIPRVRGKGLSACDGKGGEIRADAHTLQRKLRAMWPIVKCITLSLS